MFQLLQLQVPDDHDAFAFAADSWLNSYRAACKGGEDHELPLDMAQYLVRRMAPQAYFAALRPYVQGELRMGFLLATLEDDEDVFAGFAAHRGGTLHYIYVKKWFRRQGLATQILQRLDLDTHCTRTWPWVESWLLEQCIPYEPEEAFRERSQTTT